jgi:stage V sporulation protein D (sporulation-specific penicillin-binding protein)
MAKGTTVRMWRRSLIVMVVLVVLGFGVLAGRLFYLQMVDGENLRQLAIKQQLKNTTIGAQRGTIYDCNMKPLAQSATVWQVVLEPVYLNSEDMADKKPMIVEKLAEILDMDPADVQEKADKKGSYYTILKRKVETDVKEQIVAFKEENKITSGISLQEDSKRYYPYGSFASAVLGFTGYDNQGLAGLEAQYDEYLTGTSGRLVTAKNAVGTDMPYEYEQMEAAQNGYNLVLSIDEVVQHFLEKNLEQGIKDNLVQNRAAAIVMDVQTGAILGMAVKGDFDPNEPFTIADEMEASRIKTLPEEERAKATNEALQQQWRNKAVNDTYYPGSVFKIITSAMGLEEGVINEESQFYCNGSILPYEGASRPIHCHKRIGHGQQSFVEALCNSCNPAFISIGRMVGAEKFYQYYSAFGFADKTGIDLPGEASDIFFSSDGSMGPADLAVASFGQNFSITPVQMLTAVAAVANGGKLVQPHVVERIVDDEGNIIKSAGSYVKRQVISEDVAKRLCAILQENATTGSGKNGYVAGYRVGGKTGTSEKKPDTNPKTYIASFCGFAPAENPRIAMLVYYDNPQGASYYGSAVAAPTFRAVMEDVLPYLGVERIYTEAELAKLDTVTPDVLNRSVEEAQNEIRSAELQVKLVGDGEQVVAQIPEPGKSIPKQGTVVLYTDSNTAASDTVVVPDLTGKSLAVVNQEGLNANLNISIQGATEEGVKSVSQDIPAGTTVSRWTVVTVSFVKEDQVM